MSHIKREKGTGSIISRDGKLYARLRYIDKFGRTRSMEKLAVDRSEAKRHLKSMKKKLDVQGPIGLEADKATFRQLADLYKQRRLIAAEYGSNSQGELTTKQRGLRSLKSPLRWHKLLRDHFGKIKLRDIAYADLEDFRSLRSNALTASGKRLSITSVNREMELLRSMLNFAVQNELLAVSPFVRGPALISKADEYRRDRVLSHDEECRLLAVCEASFTRTYKRNGKQVTATFSTRRNILKALIVAAVDTALRKNELLTLRWSDINVESRTITVLAFNSKTARPRTVGMTPRLHAEIRKLYDASGMEPQDLVFGTAGGNLGRAFRAACKDADITGLSFHDLRHTAITRMVRSGLPHTEVMKISGHTQMATFLRYLNPDAATVVNNADVLAAYNDARVPVQEIASEVVN